LRNLQLRREKTIRKVTISVCLSGIFRPGRGGLFKGDHG
jgi:hypothetical protein